MSQKYVIVHFIDVKSVPHDFPMSQWPLHVTLLANFQISKLEHLKDRLKDLSLRTKPFEIKADGEALFGPQESVAVSLIHPNDNIKGLHGGLLELTTKLGAVFDEPVYTADGYRPHATIQLMDRLQDQQVLTLNNFTLIDMYPGEDIKQRQVIETYQLNHLV